MAEPTEERRVGEPDGRGWFADPELLCRGKTARRRLPSNGWAAGELGGRTGGPEAGFSRPQASGRPPGLFKRRPPSRPPMELARVGAGCGASAESSCVGGDRNGFGRLAELAEPSCRTLSGGWSGSRTVLVSGRPAGGHVHCADPARGGNQNGRAARRLGGRAGGPEDCLHGRRLWRGHPAFSKDGRRPRSRVELARVGGWRRRPHPGCLARGVVACASASWWGRAFTGASRTRVGGGDVAVAAAG